MNSGTLCFVFNDNTEFYFPNANRKTIVYVNQKKKLTTFVYEKFPEEQEVKKKIFILEAFSKSIKKFKNQSHQNEKIVKVQQYAKTKHAAMFYLSNESIQAFFNDKVTYLISKNSIYIQTKNSDKL